MDRYESMRVFVAVADAQGFAAAARILAMSPPAVTRAIASLEERIGTRVFHRTTRVVRLTEAGKSFAADCRRILGEIEHAEAAAAGAVAEPSGQLTVSASVMFGRMFVAPILLDFLERHRRVTARTLLVDRIVDLVEEGIDVAVRIGALSSSSLSATRVGSVRRVVCASPAYLKAHGRPKTPTDLLDHHIVAFSKTATPEAWKFVSRSRVQTVHPQPQLVVNTADVAIAAAVAGRGITTALSYQVAQDVRAGRLKIVLAEFEAAPLPIHVVHGEGRRATAKVRAFVDFLVPRLRQNKALT